MKSSTIFIIFFLASGLVATALEDKCSCINPNKAGCRIVDPPQEGYKCRCRLDAEQYYYPECSASEIKCGSSETCPGNCTTFECCATGGGNCDGYGGITQSQWK